MECSDEPGFSVPVLLSQALIKTQTQEIHGNRYQLMLENPVEFQISKIHLLLLGCLTFPLPNSVVSALKFRATPDCSQQGQVFDYIAFF